MQQARKVLIISYGAFSGIRDSLVSAMQRRSDCDVVHAEHSLRYLRLRSLYITLIVASALIVFRTRFLRYVDKTSIAQWVHTLANRALMRRVGPVDAVILLRAADHPCQNRGTLSAVVTDHTNLLSKHAESFGLAFPEREVPRSWNQWEKRAFASQDFLFPLSRYAARSMTTDYAVAADKVQVIGAGPNLDVDAERDGIHKNYAAQKILFVGIDAERKGLSDVIEAFRFVFRRYPESRLDVVGVEGTNGEGIFYHGKVTGEPLKQLFYKAQVFVMPSLREPFGIVFLEAMWAKTVCIGTNRFAMDEFIEDGVTGYLVNPRAPSEIANRIITLFSNPSKLEEMAELGYLRACRNWSWDLVAERIFKALFVATGNHCTLG